MTTKVEKSLEVNVPVFTAYNQWTQFEDFPQFMGGVKSVTHLSDDRLEWVAEIAGVRRQWEAKVLEQVPDQKVSWAATDGATNAGSVTFDDLGGRTRVNLYLEYEPEGLVEKVGDKLNVVENQAEKDLDRFKAFIESEGYATGAWRGTVVGDGHVGTPSVEDADESRGDSGHAGVSGKAVATGLGLAAAAAGAAVAGVVGAKKHAEHEHAEQVHTETVHTEAVQTTTPVTPVTTSTVSSPEIVPSEVGTTGTAGNPTHFDAPATTGAAGEPLPHVLTPAETEKGAVGADDVVSDDTHDTISDEGGFGTSRGTGAF